LSNYALYIVKKSKTALDDKIVEVIKQPIYLLIIVIGADFAVEGISTFPELTKPLQSVIFTGEILLSGFLSAGL
jgi:hypothetical protein